MTPSERINTTISRLGMSDRQAAAYLGVPRMTMANWRAGHRKPPAVAVRLLDVLGLIEAIAPEIHAGLIPTIDK